MGRCLSRDDPRWADDPYPCWDECVRRTGCDLDFSLDTPDDPSGDIQVVTLKLWPLVHPAFQETVSPNPEESKP